MEKLQAVFSTLFTSAPQNADSLSDLKPGADSDPGDPANQPAVTALAPVSGPAGTEVTVSGRNLGDVTGVAFGDVDAASFAVTSPRQVTAVVPPAATTGALTLAGPAPLTTAQIFTVTDPGEPAEG